ncbi:baseplate J/gp47 family protein [Pseudomonas sp. TMW 2.1634]|uniref:baseplate assembly protein n=1 Tax=Pseudomonas sp. TMW 2.1634 TaxID=1886807 RepID=UPI000E70B502|nr:baseplate J/gp47 family protein [Pseudomonas sp. TMW 2.1634]AOA05645.1 phage tail protein [Pseudomonas sp. TMW 2.1634]
MSVVNLSALPAPDVLETLDFEDIYQEVLADFRLQMGDNWTALLESDPVVKLLEVAAYQKLMSRARINDAAKSSLLAYARGTDLDNRAADYGVERLTITEADPDAIPPIPKVMEKDDALLYRTQLSLEGLSVAGSRGAYEFHGLSASANVANISVDSPTFKAAEISQALRDQLPLGAIVLVCDYAAGLTNPLPGDVSLAVLPTPESTVAPAALVATVQAALSAEDVRPITDRPRSQLGQPTNFSIIAVLELLDGPSSVPVLAAANAGLAAAVAAARQLEGEMSLSAIYAALHVSGVRRVVLTQPTADVICDKRHYPNCTAINVTGVVVP